MSESVWIISEREGQKGTGSRPASPSACELQSRRGLLRWSVAADFGPRDLPLPSQPCEGRSALLQIWAAELVQFDRDLLNAKQFILERLELGSDLAEVTRSSLVPIWQGCGLRGRARVSRKSPLQGCFLILERTNLVP